LKISVLDPIHPLLCPTDITTISGYNLGITLLTSSLLHGEYVASYMTSYINMERKHFKISYF